MKKLAIILTFFTAFLFINTNTVLAIDLGQTCSLSKQNTGTATDKCTADLFCQSKNNPSNPDEGSCQKAVIGVTKPSKGFATLGDAISKILIVAFAVAVLIVLVMLILGSFEWITSGGDKEAVGKARNRIVNALIGLAVLAVAFALANVAARFTGLDLFNIQIPSPDPNAPGL